MCCYLYLPIRRGFLVAPAIAGYLADPLDVRTNHDHVVKDDMGQNGIHSLFYSILEAYPYLLPNLLGAILCWATALAVYFGIPETLPESRSARLLGKDFYSWILGCISTIGNKISNIAGSVFMFRPGRTRQHPYRAGQNDAIHVTNGRHYGSIESNGNSHGGHEEQSQATTLSSIWSRRNTRYHLLVYWFYSMVIIAIDEAFPLYCISRNNGLHDDGLSESDIGEILSISGLIFSLAQYKVYRE